MSEHVVTFAHVDPAMRVWPDGPQRPEVLKEIAGRIGRSRRRLNIMSMLATGWLPWGVRWHQPDVVPFLPLCGREYVMCCGHVLKRAEAQAFVDAGLLMEGALDHFERPTLIITDAGRAWLARNW